MICMKLLAFLSNSNSDHVLLLLFKKFLLQIPYTKRIMKVI